MRDDSVLYWIWLSERCGVASKEFGRLADKYDDPFDLYRLEEEEIEHLEGISVGMKTRLGDKALESSYAILRYCRENKVDIITYGDKRYPERLKRIETPPVLLYCLGRFPDFNTRLCIGVVGTRKMSEYGKQSAYKISYELSAAKTVIVSGMALGIDGVAACGALEASGDTVAVLGCGISVVYPKEHKKLMRSITSFGAVITEYPPTEEPNARNFPKRNRLISGLCQGVVIVEGALGSGALITASRAISQGREVFALPGKIDESNSDGPNELIRNGAHVALSSDDILNFYDFLYHGSIYYKGHTKAKKKELDVDRALAKYGVSDIYYRGRYKKDEDKSFVPQEEVKIDKPCEAVKEKPSAEVAPREDNSEEVLSALDPKSRLVFEHMPIDKAVAVDALADTGLPSNDILTAFTMLELSGLIQALPGGLYLRK